MDRWCKLFKSDLKLMENRAKQIKLPADMGRIPYKISTGDGFSSFTADQWKSFILIYAIPLMWNLLVTSDQNILANFVKACSLLTYRIINNDIYYNDILPNCNYFYQTLAKHRYRRSLAYRVTLYIISYRYRNMIFYRYPVFKPVLASVFGKGW